MKKFLQVKRVLAILNCPINLGYFAKHLNYNNSIEKIEITDSNINDINNITVKLKKITKKYYKYKGKYMKTKTTSSTINLNSSC